MYRLYRLWHSIKRLPCTTRRGVKNIIYWLPVIWNDRPWDHYYFFVMLAHKLASIEKGLDREDIEIINVRMARIVMERLRDDEYDDNAFALHDEKWGKLKIECVPVPGRNTERFVSSRPKAVTEKEKEQECKEFRRAIKHAQYLRQQDLDCFADIFRKHVLGWWD